LRGQYADQDATGSEGHEGNLGYFDSEGYFGYFGAMGYFGYFPSSTGHEGYLSLPVGQLFLVEAEAERDIAVIKATKHSTFFIIFNV